METGPALSQFLLESDTFAKITGMLHLILQTRLLCLHESITAQKPFHITHKIQ
jgi:hypothetical protein